MKVIDDNNTTSDSNKYIGTDDNYFRNLAGYEDIESYTIGGLIDDLYISLVCSKYLVTDESGNRITISRYYSQAWKLERLISVGRPSPCFTIQLSNLNPKLKQALRDLDDDTRNYVVRQAIGRIFENINPRLYHLSVARKLRWNFEP